jgi:hypothetical protein
MENNKEESNLLEFKYFNILDNKKNNILSFTNTILSKDCFNIIIQFLDIKNIIKLRACSKYFNEFIINNEYWKIKLLKRCHTSRLSEQSWFFL